MSGFKDRKGNVIAEDEALIEQLHGRPVTDQTTAVPLVLDVTALLQNKEVATGTPSFGSGSTKAITANFTVAGDGVHNADATSAAFTVTLPSPVGIAGRSVVVTRINAGGNAVTIKTPAGSILFSSTLRGNARVLNAQNATMTLVSDGHNWKTVSSSGTIT